MKKHILTLILLISFCNAEAQNYQCVQQSGVRWFTNSAHSLFGIRIDSVKTVGASTVFYPYRSPRGNYLKNQKLNINSGSWVGKNIIVQPGGVHYFDNLWGDTIAIHSQAALNDSWIFYDDTTSIWYQATITAFDTMTVLNVLDSVKTITLTAFKNSNVLTTDSMNNAQIIISKTHGFVQIFDLFVFPFHEPGKVYQKGFDYFLDGQLNYGIKNVFNKLCDFHNPTYGEVYVFNTGDFFEYHKSGSAEDAVRTEQVLQKTYSSSQFNYSIDRKTHVYSHPGGQPQYFDYHDTFMLNVGQVPIFDTTLMPDEWGQKYSFVYNPEDTQFCIKAPYYQIYTSDITTHGYIDENAESHGGTDAYKVFCGHVLTSYGVSTVGSSEWLSYTNRNGKRCGYSTDIKKPTRVNSNFRIYPNPAPDVVNIEMPQQSNYDVQLMSSLGQIIKHYSLHGDKLAMPVNDIPSGIYQVRLSDETRFYSQTVIVNH